MIDPPTLGPTFCDLSVSAMVMTCLAVIAALDIDSAIAAFELVCLVAIFTNLLVCFMLLICESALRKLPCYIILVCQDCLFWFCLICTPQVFLFETFYSWHHVVYLALFKITPIYSCMYIYYCVWKYNIYIVCTCLYVQSWWTVVNYIHDAYWVCYIQLGVLVNVCTMWLVCL